MFIFFRISRNIKQEGKSTQVLVDRRKWWRQADVSGCIWLWPCENWCIQPYSVTSWWYDLLLLWSTETEETFSSQYTVGNESGAVEAVLLNTCMQTDFIGCILWLTQILWLQQTGGQVGCVSYFCHVEDHSSVLLPPRRSLLPVWWVKNIPVFS